MIKFLKYVQARFFLQQGVYCQVILRDALLVIEEVNTTKQVTSFSRRFCAEDYHRAVVSDMFTKLTLVDTGKKVRRVIIRVSRMQNDGRCQDQIMRVIATVYTHPISNGMNGPMDIIGASKVGPFPLTFINV